MAIEKRIYPEFDYSDQINFQGHFPPEEVQPVEVDPLTSVMDSMQTRKPSSVDSMSAGMIADTVAASLPAVSALLGGASPRVTSAQFDRANAYAQKRGDALVPSKQNLMALEDENGNPYYELADNSLGKMPYYQKKLTGSGANQDRQFQPVTMQNIKTGELRGATVAGSGYYDQSGNKFDMNEWFPFKDDELIRERTVQGGSTVKARNRYTGDIRGVSAQSGLGNYYGNIPKEEAQAGIKAGEKAKASTQKALEAMKGAERAYTILKQPNLTPELASAGIFAIIKANNGEKLSDSDYAKARGTEFKSYLRQAEEWAEGKIGGNIPQHVLDAYAEMARQMAESKRQEIESIKESYVPQGFLPKEGQKRVEKSAGMDNRKPEMDLRSFLKGN